MRWENQVIEDILMVGIYEWGYKLVNRNEWSRVAEEATRECDE